MLHNRRFIQVRAPLRLSFVGGGTDFPEYFERKPGMVVSTTINSFVYVTLKDMFDTNVRVHHSVIETEAIASRISHGYARTALEHFGLFKGIEAIMVSDVMATGSGLGASSAMMSALAVSGRLLRGQSVPGPEELAQLTIELEKRAATVGGWQDQYAVAYGGFNVLRFSGKGVSVEPVALAPEVRADLESRVLLVFTNLARHSTPIQTEMVNHVQDGAKEGMLDRMYQAALAFETELCGSRPDVTQLGRILDETWHLKKDINPLASNLYVDELYDLLRGNGIVGAKLTGAGGGGFFVAIAENLEAKKSLMYKLYPQYIGMDVRFHDRGTEVLWTST